MRCPTSISPEIIERVSGEPHAGIELCDAERVAHRASLHASTGCSNWEANTIAPGHRLRQRIAT
jgi:hypothetical protein